MAGLKRTGVELVADGASRFNDDISTANKSVADFGRQAERSAGGVEAFGKIASGALMRVGAVAVDLGIRGGKAIKDFIADSVGKAGDFQAGMQEFAAVTGDALDQSGKSAADFSKIFIQMGRDLPVSTGDVQQAAIELAKGGIDPATIAAGGLRTSLDLAAAGGVELADSANILAKQLGVWVDAAASADEKSSFLTQTANLLSQAANVTTSDVSEMALGLANAGGTAKTAGLSYQELVQTMALVAPGFSSAADAGTSLKTFLSRLIPTTKPATAAMIDLGLATKEGVSKFYDAQGAFIGMEAAAALLQEKTAGLSEAQRLMAFQAIFGADAIRIAAAVAEKGAAGYAAMGGQMQAAGTVSEQAAARQQGYNTALENTKGSVEALQLTIGTYLLPMLATLLNTYISPGINAITTFADAFFASGDKLSFLVAALTAAVPVFGTLLTTGQTIADFLANQFVPGAQSLATVFLTALQPSSTAIGTIWATVLLPALLTAGTFIMGTLVPAITAAATAVNVWYQENGGLAGILKDVAGGINTVVTGVQSMIGFVQQNVAVQSVLVGLLAALATGYTLATAASIAHQVATKAGAVATGLMTAAQTALNVVLAANPIGLAVIALAALAAALIYAYNHSETFRKGVNDASADFQRGLVVIENWAAGVKKRFGEVVADFERGWSLISTATSVTWELIKSTVSQKINDVVTFFTELPGRITAALGNLATLLIQAGTDLIQGLINGLKSIDVGSVLGGILQSGIAAAKALVGIKSPSTKTRDEIGKPMGEGIVVGIEGTANSVKQAIGKTILGAIQVAMLAPAATKAGKDVATAFKDGLAKGLDDEASVKQIFGGKLRNAVEVAMEDVKQIIGGKLRGSERVEDEAGAAGERIGAALVAGFNRIVSGFNFGGVDMTFVPGPGYVPPSNPSKGAKVSPPASPAQQAQAASYSSMSTTNYTYAPTYGAAPRSPQQDFLIMQALAR